MRYRDHVVDSTVYNLYPFPTYPVTYFFQLCRAFMMPPCCNSLAYEAFSREALRVLTFPNFLCRKSVPVCGEIAISIRCCEPGITEETCLHLCKLNIYLLGDAALVSPGELLWLYYLQQVYTLPQVFDEALLHIKTKKHKFACGKLTTVFTNRAAVDTRDSDAILSGS